MHTFKELYEQTIQSVLNNDPELTKLNSEEYDASHLNCILNPTKHPLVIRTDNKSWQRIKKMYITAKCLDCNQYLRV